MALTRILMHFPQLRCANFHHHAKTKGNILLHLGFNQPLEENVTVIAYSMYNAHVELKHMEKPRLVIG